VDSAQGYLARLRSRGIQTSYVREYYIPFQMTPDRMAGLESQIRPRPETPLNRDFSPIAYYFDAVLWSTRFDRASEPWLKRLAHVGLGGFFGMTALAAFTLVLLVWRRPRATAALSAAVMGLDMIGLEILLLLGFQAIHGYVYHQLAIVIAMFMAGMAVGSWRGLGRGDKLRPGDMRRLAAIQIVAAAAPLILCLLLGGLSRVRSAAVFPVLAFLCGLVGGYQFPLASRIYFAGAPEARRGPGTLYALDLAGSCLGAVALSVWLIPLFGFWNTALVMGVVCLASALALAPLALRR
jgi:spermidine synthase